VELEAIQSLARADFENKRLIQVPEKGDGSCAAEAMTPLTDSPAAGVSVHTSKCWFRADWDTDDRKVDFPQLSSPSRRIVIVCDSMENVTWHDAE
jgi:hypothetical protein